MKMLDMQAEAARAAAAAERLTALEAAAAEQQARLEGEAAALARAQLALEAERDQLKVGGAPWGHKTTTLTLMIS